MNNTLRAKCSSGQVRRTSVCMALLAPCVLPIRTNAQDAPQPQPETAPLQEVTVSAERTDTILRKTPVSVGAIGQDEIQSRGITQLKDIVGVVAGVTVPNGDGNLPQAVGIRGVGVSIPAMSQAVGVYVDDIPLVRGYATARWDLPDIERIEVLRGPQGTLYGQNTTAGAVKIVSIDPSANRAAWISASVGDYGAHELHGYANGSLGVDGLSASVAFSRRANDGFGYNATKDERVNKLDATQFRTKLGLKVDAQTSAVLAIDGLRDRSDNNDIDFPFNAPDSAPRVTFVAAPSGAFKRDAGGVSLKIDHAFNEGLHFRSITGLRFYSDDPTVADYGGLVVQRYGIDQTVMQHAVTQEFQLQGKQEKVAWTVGAMLVTDRFAFDRFTIAYPLAAAAPGYSEAKTHLSTTDWGLYGQARYALQETTGLTVGLRAYRTRQTGENDYWATDADKQRLRAIYLAPNLSTSKTGASPKLVLDHQWTPDLFAYASVAQGEKFGGFNRAAQSLISAEVATQPEKVTTYELGGKGRLAGGLLTANLALFYNDYRNCLASLNNSVVNGVVVTDSVLVNAGKAKTYGVDLDVAAKVEHDTDVTLSVEWLRSKFVSFENPTGTSSGDYVGNQLPYAPEFSLGARASHTMPLADGSSLEFDASIQYLRKQFSDPANTEALSIPAQTYVNLGAQYVGAQRHWRFSVAVKNLLQKTYVLVRDQIPSVGVDAGYYNPPRTVMVTARYDY